MRNYLRGGLQAAKVGEIGAAEFEADGDRLAAAARERAGGWDAFKSAVHAMSLPTEGYILLHAG